MIEARRSYFQTRISLCRAEKERERPTVSILARMRDFSSRRHFSQRSNEGEGTGGGRVEASDIGSGWKNYSRGNADKVDTETRIPGALSAILGNHSSKFIPGKLLLPLQRVPGIPDTRRVSRASREIREIAQ